MPMKILFPVAAMALSLMLSACGGGSSGSEADPPVFNSSSSSSSSSGSSSSSSSGSASSGSSSGGEAPMLPQSGNPMYGELDNYKSWLGSSLSADQTRADNMLTWQMDHGGFYKNDESTYDAPWDGSKARSGWTGAGGVELGTIDNDATVTELMFLADVYQRSGYSKYREAAHNALEFLLTMQYESGGWPQVYPARTGTTYSNYVTFNDGAMARVLILLDRATRQETPLGGDLFTDEQRARMQAAIDKGVAFILKAQIVQAGAKTVWCAQHDPVTYEPRGARDYELPSKSGKESMLVTAFLMSQPQTEQVEAAVRAALAWYRSPVVQVADTAYVKRSSASDDENYNPIQPRSGSTLWYRFYDLGQDVGFFADRSGIKQYDIMMIDPERRYGYEWGGNYGSELIRYADSVDYF
ncbi:pectate lyase [Microbulbifer elongatus]|uniref:pectate lyase n=1 Tax=Microbulbifer elongatus TaxID=86173 RepID=UPI001E5E6015|nr:pectate lyase [Microbulbifer elongatus]